MVTNDATILRIKHDVLYEVAKLAWNGELDEEHKNQVPYTIIPGPQAQFRCCIYKEREIIRQRVRLAEGKCPTSGKDSRNVVQVIGAACEECPIASYTVTDNCRKCMGKACQNSCNFGAISMGDTTLIRTSVRSAASAQMPARTTRSHIWSARARRPAR
mgnify:CR=1 FL=1